MVSNSWTSYKIIMPSNQYTIFIVTLLPKISFQHNEYDITVQAIYTYI